MHGIVNLAIIFLSIITTKKYYHVYQATRKLGLPWYNLLVLTPMPEIIIQMKL